MARRNNFANARAKDYRVDEPEWFPLPQDTAERVTPLYRFFVNNDRNKTRACELTPGMYNIGLLLSRLCPNAERLSSGNYKAAFLKETAAAGSSDQKHLGKAAEAVIARRAELVAAYPSHETFIGTLAERMIVGMGNPNALETSMTLHPVYGFPIIPGSAVKGAAKHYRLVQIAEALCIFPLDAEELAQAQARNERSPYELLESALTAPESESATILERLKKIERLAEMRKEYEAFTGNPPATSIATTSYADFETYAKPFREVFGTSNTKRNSGETSNQHQGKVDFMVALPESWTLEIDVLTPHYGDYYQDSKHKTPPADWLSPIPVPFLTVANGGKFRFDLTGDDAMLTSTAKRWLQEGLASLGVGAKTLKGYGRFTDE